MNKKSIRLSVILFSFIFFMSMLLGVLRICNLNEITIDFSQNEIKSYPGQTAWLLAEIHMNSANMDATDSISVSTNHTVAFEFTVWSSQKTKIVEIFLQPNQSHLNSAILVTLSVNTKNNTTQNSAIVSIIDWSHSLSFEVEQMISCFTVYLIENLTYFTQAENNSLEFMGNIPQILVVEHYLFRSDSWELEFSRHVMLIPDDWVKIYLRPRNSFQPSWAGKIFSWGSGNHSIFEIEPPKSVFR